MQSSVLSLADQVETMLRIWGEWSKKNGLNGLGYSSLSNIGWIQENAGVIIQRGCNQSKAPIDENPVAEEVETWVVELGHDKPMEVSVLILIYVNGYPKDIVARKLRVSIRMVEFRLKTARTWLEGRLSAKKYAKRKKLR